MHATKRQTEAIRGYVESQAHEEVVHLEKAASELVGPVRHDIWDVHCADSRWWVITEPTNLYSQADFKSRDVALTFHIGLSIRVSYLHERKVPVAPGRPTCCRVLAAVGASLRGIRHRRRGRELPGCWGATAGVPGLLHRRDDQRRARARWPGAAQAAGLQGLDGAARQHFGGRRGQCPPAVIPQEALRRDVGVRQLADPCQERHPMDAEIGLKTVEHLLGVFTAARLRLGQNRLRCGLRSYQLVGGTCERCGWVDEAYEPPESPACKRRMRRAKGRLTFSQQLSRDHLVLE